MYNFFRKTSLMLIICLFPFITCANDGENNGKEGITYDEQVYLCDILAEDWPLLGDNTETKFFRLKKPFELKWNPIEGQFLHETKFLEDVEHTDNYNITDFKDIRIVTELRGNRERISLFASVTFQTIHMPLPVFIVFDNSWFPINAQQINNMLYITAPTPNTTPDRANLRGLIANISCEKIE